MASNDTQSELAQPDKDKLRQQLKELEDQGVIDLDAPLRAAVPYITQRIEETRQRVEAAEEARVEWYCLIGSAFLFCELEIEF
jgi:hypothetical protein